MQYLEGETLADRLKKGVLPLEQGLRYSIEISDALDKAHRAGVIHRDLKPGNIMITKAGAKLLDFGLAKTRSVVAQDFSPAVAAGSKDPRYAPTMLPTLTGQGTILGTFQYMAPEQLEGKDADARTDIFALGAVLYEMLTGRKAFEGKSHASLIHAIMGVDPPLISTVQPLAPPALDRVVKTCLAKDPDDRWQTARDLLRELKWMAESLARGLEGREAQPVTKRWQRPVPLVATGLIAAIVASGAVWTLRPAAPTGSSGIARLTVALPVGDQVGTLVNPALALSADAARLVYVGVREGRQQLYVRPLDSLESKPITGTEGATNPFFSPDGQWVGFFAQGKLKKVSILAGAVQVLCDAPSAVGGSWGPDNTIYFAATNISGLSKVSASGGSLEAVTRLDRSKGEVSHRWPQVLPGGKAVLFTAWTGPGRDEKQIHVQSLETGERHILVQAGETGRYVPTGHVVYARTGAALMAVPMDLVRLEASGPPLPLTEEVRSDINGEGAQYAVSDVGTLVFLPGNPQQLDRRLSEEERLTTKENALQTPGSFSSDGHWLAFFEIVQPTGFDIWVLRFDGTRRPQPFLATRFDEKNPRFSPDGRWLAYVSEESGRPEVYVQPFPGPGQKWPISIDGGIEPVWWRTGRELFYVNGDKLMAVVATQPTFIAGSPRFLFQGRYELSTTGVSGFDVSPDGQRFLRVQTTRPDPPATQINVVMNWFAELKQRVPK